jgi:hypothetical protein
MALLTLMLNTCCRDYKLDTASLPDTPVNPEEINSEYND